RVAGQDKTISGEIPRVLCGEGAEPDPEGEGSEKQDTLLSEKRHQEQRDGGADHCPDDPKEALRQDEPALWLCDDEDREQRPFRLIKVEGKRDQKREQPRGSCLRCENPGNPARAREWIRRPRA